MDNRFILGTMDQVERERLGLSVINEFVLRCADCDNPLLHIVKIKESKKSNTINACCPCGGTSFRYKADGETIFQPCKGLVIDDIETEQTDPNSPTFSSIIYMEIIKT